MYISHHILRRRNDTRFSFCLVFSFTSKVDAFLLSSPGELTLTRFNLDRCGVLALVGLPILIGQKFQQYSSLFRVLACRGSWVVRIDGDMPPIISCKIKLESTYFTSGIPKGFIYCEHPYSVCCSLHLSRSQSCLHFWDDRMLILYSALHRCQAPRSKNSTSYLE